MDKGQQINQEFSDIDNGLFEFNDEDISEIVLQEMLDVPEEIIIQECPEQEIILPNLDMNHSTNVST